MTTPQDAPIHTVEDVDLFIAQQNYEAKSSDEICLNKGDVVVILDTVESTAPKKAKLDPELDQVVESATGLLDTSAARHKIAVKPKKKHRTSKQLNVNINARWKVRVLTSLDEAGAPKEGWVPMLILRPADEPGTGDGPPPPDTQYRRDAVIRELIDTEEEFCKDLQDVLQRYYFPLAMDARMGNKRPPKCVRDNHELIFGNLKQIADFHNTVLLEGIKYYASEPVMLGRVFLRLERDFDKHVNYCRDEPLAQHFLQNNMDAKDYFAEVSQRLGDDKTLSEHLKLPIQRINDYQLLLKELVKYTCWLQEDASYLQRALELMLTVPHRASDDKFTSNIEGYRGSIHKLGRLLAHDWYSITKTPFETAPSIKKERYLFLFKARILVCKVKRISEDRSIFLLKDIIKLPDVEVRDFPNDPRTFELHQANTPGYPLTLTAHRDLVKLYWLDEIRQYSSDIVALEEHIADDLQIDKTEEITEKLDTQVTNGITSEILVSPASESYKTAEDHTVSEALETTLKETELSEAKTIIVEAKRAIVIPVQEPLTAEIQKTVKKSIEEEESFETSSVKKLKVSHETEKQTLNKTHEEKVILTTEENKQQIQQKQKEEIKSLKKQQITNNKTEISNQLLQSTVETTEELKVVVKEEKLKEEEKKETVKVDICTKNQAKTAKETETVIQDHTKEEKKLEVAKVDNLKKDQLTEEKSQLVEVKKERKEAESIREAHKQIELEHKSETVEIKESSLQKQENLETVKVEISKKTKEEKEPKTVEVNISEKDQLEANNKLEATKTEVSTTNKDEKKQEAVKSDIPKQNTEEKKPERVEVGNLKKDQVQEQSKSEVIKNEVSKQTQEEKKSENINVDTSKKNQSQKNPEVAKTEKKPESEELDISKKEQNKSEITLVDSTKQYQDQKKQNLEAVQLKKENKSEISEVTTHKEHKTEEKKKSEKIKKEIGIDINKDISKEENKPEATKIDNNNKTTAPVGTSKQLQEETKEDTDMSQHHSSFKSSRTEYREEITASYSSTGTQSVSEVHQNVAVSSLSEVDGRIISSENSTIAIEDGGIYSRSRGDAINGSSVEIQEIVTESTGKPAFSKTIESCTVEPGDSAEFSCKLTGGRTDTFTWLKDDKPFDDKLADRVVTTISESGDHFTLKVLHCLDLDSGIYTALAINEAGKASCSAQLVVKESHEKPREPEGPSAPVFLVRLKDTELTEGTYLRFMVKIKGEPKPKVTFYKDNKDITESHKRIQIVRNHEETGFYEMVIDKVKQEDAGTYRCVAENKLGKDTTEAKVKVSDQKKNIFGELEKEKKPLEPGETPQFMWQRNGVYFEPDERFKVLLDEQEDSLALVFSHVKPEDAGLYTCVAQTSNGMLSCSAELTVQGTVLPKEPTKPKITIEQRKYEVSAGNSAMLDLQITGFPRPLVTWSYNGQSIEAGSKYKFLYEDTENYSLVIKNVTSEDSGKYQVKAKNDLGTDSSELELSVRAPPRFKTKMEDNSCIVGETLKVQMEIEGTPQPTLKIYKDGQELTQSDRISIEHDDTLYILIIYDAKMSDTGSYSAVASNSLAQVSEFWKTKIYSPPKILKKLENVTGREYDTVSFEVKVESDPEPTVTWYKNDQEITSEASNITRIADPKTGTYSLKISNAAFNDAGNYKCILKNDHGTSEETARLDIRCAPTVRDKIQNITVTEGDINVELKANVEGFPKPTGKWFLGDVEITESRNEFKTAVDDDGNYKLIIKEANHDLTGKYTLKLSNDLGTTENSAQLTVNCKPKLKKKLEDTSVDEGATLKLQIEVIACPDPEVKWYKDGSEVSADARIKITRDTKRKENYNLTVDLVKYEDGGEYEVIVTNVLGSISCKSTVTVYSNITETLDSANNGHEEEEITSRKIDKNIITYPIVKNEIGEGEIAEKANFIEIIRESHVIDNFTDNKSIPLQIDKIKASAQIEAQENDQLEKSNLEKGLTSNETQKSIEEILEEKPKRARILSKASIEKIEINEKNLEINSNTSEPKQAKVLTSSSIEKVEIKGKQEIEIIDTSEEPKKSKLLAKSKVDISKSKESMRSETSNIDASIQAEYKRSDSEKSGITITEIEEPLSAKIIDLQQTEPQKSMKDNVEDGEDGEDQEMSDLFKRIKKQRSVLEEILTDNAKQTEEAATPQILDSNLEDGTVYESQTKKYFVKAFGTPIPEAEWLYNGEPMKGTKTVKITQEERTYNLEISDVRIPKNEGKYECKLKNHMGEVSKSCNLKVINEGELRKPKVKQGLVNLKIPKNETTTMSAVIVGDPCPDVTWYHKNLLTNVTKEIEENEVIMFSKDCKEIEDSLKECTYTLTISKSLHEHSGEYTIKAKNKYGECETSARLDILLKPEIYDVFDVSVVPGEQVVLSCTIHANPEPVVAWIKDDVEVKNSSSYHIEKIRETEQYKLKMDKVSLADDGKYIIKASNEIGESTATLHLNTQTQMPAFITKLTDQTIDHKETAILHVRCDGLPKPSVKWFRDGKPIETSDRIKIDTKVEAQVTSDLTIQDFDDSDSGKYTCIAQNVIGDVETSCRVTMAQTSPDFGRKLDKSLEVFEGEPLELKTTITGSPKPSVKWYKDGELIKDGDKRIKTCVLPEGIIKLSIENATPEDSGAYKVILTNPNGQAASLCAVIVNPEPLAPKFVKNLKNVSVPAGQPLKLEAKIEGYPSPKLEWFKDDIPIRPSQVYTMTKQPNGLVQLEVDFSKPENAGVYTLTASNKLGEVTDKATVEIQPESTKPEFKGELLPVKVVEGFPAKLQVKVSGHPKPQVSWSRNGAEIIPDDKHVKIVEMPDGTSALLIDKCTPHDSGVYQVKISNPNGEASTKAQLTVTPKKDPNAPEERPTFIHGLRDVVTDEGIPLKIEAPIRGNPVPNVSWTKDGKPIEPSPRILETCDGTRIELNIDAAEPSDAGVYGCKLVNPLGEDASECKATVRKIYQPPNFIQKFTDLQQLPTYDAKFPCRISGVPYPEITWYKDNKPIRESEKYHIKRDGDSTCLYVRNCVPDDNGRYKCAAVNREGTATCEAALQVVDKIETRQKIEPPSFLKKIGDTELYKGMTGKFTACATGFPEPEVEWQKDGIKLFPSERIRMEKDRSGLLRLTIERVDTPDTGKYTCRIFNEHGQAECHATLTFDSIDIRPKRPVGEQYTGFDKHKSAGVPVPLADPPIISKMTDRHLTLSWKPSVPTAPRFPVTYQVEMLELPHGDWKTVRTGIRSCVCGVPNLEPFHDYKFRIRVENSFGISDPSPFAVTHRCKLEPEPPTLTPYLPPGAHFSLESSQYFPKDFDIERPLHGNICQPPVFLRQDDNRQYGVKNHNADLVWFVYGYPKPKISYTFNDEPIEMGGRYDCSYTRNGQATLFVNKMLDRDVGMYEAIAKNEHGEARQRVRLEIAEPPRFYKRLDEQHVMLRKSIRLEAKITGVPYPEIKWYKDWQPLASSARVKIQFIDPDTCILVINDLIARDEGLYSISARNVAGTISSSAMIYIADNEIDYNYYNYVPHISSIRPKTKLYEDFYDLGDELGRGTQGVTYHAVERLTGRNYAAKIMHGGSNFKPFMYNELEIMNTLNHRKLIRLQDAFERDSFFMLVTELAAGGELVKDNLLKQTYYTESEIAAYIRQLLYGIEHMHDKSIAHCGLTIGDLLISHPGSDDLKICDFGLARRIQMGRLAPLHYGVPEYVSPETAKGESVTLSTDMWSIGIITYILLSGISPFRGKDDRETLNKIRGGNWVFTDDWWVNISGEAKDFIRKLLVTGPELRLDVKSALKHPWLTRADKIITNEYQISTDRLRNYYNLFREWYDNASCKRWYRRNKLSVADEHPSCMVYPPGESYTPETRTPERVPRKAGSWETHIPERPNLDYEIGVIKSESHYQNGPDTYLLQLRDTDFPVRLRKYMKVAASVRPGYTLSDSDYDWRTPSIHERRRFTDVMDEEIDDERKARISKYGSPDTYTLRRLRHELGYRLDTYAEAEALIESKQHGSLPFFREKQQIVAIIDNQDAVLTCFAVGDPTPVVQWFKNDIIIGESNRVKLETDEEGRSILKFCPASEFDVGLYKIVARNKVGQTFTRTRVVLGMPPDSPDSPTASQVSDTEVLLNWRQPKHDGYSAVLCYSLQYKLCDDVEWTQCADNIDHEFYLIKDLQPEKNYIFRLAARNSIGWGEFGVPTAMIKTKPTGAPKIQISRAMTHLQQLTDSGHPITVEEKIKLDYSVEQKPIEWDTTSNVSDLYNFISEISRGRFSVVVKGVNKQTDAVVAAKLIECKEETIDKMEQEWNAWRSLRHERIASLLAGFRKSDSPIAALIQERLQGADVITYLSSRHEYSEQTVTTIISQVIDGLQYLHWRGLCHLNIQPDNVVLATVRSVQVKLVDFGSTQKVSKLGTTVSNVDCHPEYVAPEILNEEPAFPQTDIWSVGVLTYVLLSGTSPFRGADPDETRQNISFVRYRFEHLYKELTQEAVRFIMLIFKRHPTKRPTAEECHEHRWFMPTDFMIKKRERAIFLGNRLKEYNNEYHTQKTEAAQTTSLSSISGTKGPLGRSNSIQEELLTAP